MRKHPYDFLTFGNLNLLISSIVGWEKLTVRDTPSLAVYTEGRSHFVEDLEGERFNTLVDAFTSAPDLQNTFEAAIDPAKLAAAMVTTRPHDSASFSPKPWKETPEEHIGKLQAEIQALRTMAEERGENIEKLGERINEQMSTIADYRMKVVQKAETIIARDKTIRDLEARIVEWAEGDRERVRHLGDKQREITLLEARVAELDGRMLDLTGAYDVARASATKLSDQLDQYRGMAATDRCEATRQLDALRSKLGDTSTALLAAQRELSHANGKLLDNTAQLVDARERIKTLEHALVSDPGSKTSLEHELQQTRAERNDLRIQLGRIRTIASVVKAD